MIKILVYVEVRYLQSKTQKSRANARATSMVELLTTVISHLRASVTGLDANRSVWRHKNVATAYITMSCSCNVAIRLKYRLYLNRSS